MGAAAGLWGPKWTAIPTFSATGTAIADGSPEFQLNAKGIGVELSAAGEIVGVIAGGRKIMRAEHHCRGERTASHQRAASGSAV